MAEKEKEEGAMPRNTAAALAYVLGFISGVVIWAVQKKDEFVRFHAIQSIGLCVVWLGGWAILTVIPVIGWILLPFWGLLFFIFWLVSIVKAYQGERFELPIIGPPIQKFGKQLGL